MGKQLALEQGLLWLFKGSAMTSYQAIKNPANMKRLWFVVDATGHRVGRLASVIATVLQGKHKPFYHPAIEECGDHVIVLNANKATFSGQKEKQKLYRHHTGYMGGLKEIPVRRWRERHPHRILEAAVNGMLPKNRTRRLRKSRLHILEGEEHPHLGQVAQNPFKVALQPVQRAAGGSPTVSGYFVELTDLEDRIEVTVEPYVPESTHRKNAEKARKAKLHKELRAYLLGRGERPDFLPSKNKD